MIKNNQEQKNAKVLHLKIETILCKLSEKRQINGPKPGYRHEFSRVDTLVIKWDEEWQEMKVESVQVTGSWKPH